MAKELNEKDITQVSAGTDDNEEVKWTWCKCFRPSCGYEDRAWGRIEKDAVILCPMCHHDSFKSKGIFEK